MHEDLGRAAAPQEVHDDIEHLRVQDRWGLEVLAGRRGTSEDEDAGADDGADAQRGQRPRAEAFPKPVLGSLRFGDQLVDGFAASQLRSQ